MPQHFLLSKAARTQSITEVARLTEKEAYRVFCKARWPKRGIPDHCPHCGVVGKPWRLKSRKRLYAIWKCRDKNCRKEFTVTSGTIFANRKLSFGDILAILAMSANGQKGKSALQTSLDMDICWRTAWHNLTKVRQAMARERDGLLLRGVVEMDGMYLNRHQRPPNVHADAPDGRLAQNRHPGNRCIVGIRERRPNGRTVSLITFGEDRQVIAAAAQRFIAPGSILITDQHEAYAPLAAHFLHRVVDHGERYVQYPEPGDPADLGDAAEIWFEDLDPDEVPQVSTNLVESFWSRVRRSAKGIHHRMNATYLDWYVAELAWREDHRRVDNKTKAELMLKLALAHPVSRWLAGYYQGNHPPRDALMFNPARPPAGG